MCFLIFRDISFLYDALVEKRSDKPTLVSQSLPTTREKNQGSKEKEISTLDVEEKIASVSRTI